jgi:hypothetical protein
MVQQRRGKAPLARHLLLRTQIRVDETLQSLLNGTVPQCIPCSIGVVTQQAVAGTLAQQHFEVRTPGYRVKVQTSEIAQRQEIVHDQLLTRWHKGTGFQHLAEQGDLRWMTLTDHFDKLAHQGGWVSLYKAGETMHLSSFARGGSTGRGEE